MMKASQLFIQFLIFTLIFNPLASAVIVDTNVFTPTDFETMQTVAASPMVLESKILVAGETSTMTTSLDNGKISISDSVHTFREVSMDYQMLIDEVDGFNGKQIALTHINDAGEIDYRRVVSVSPDVNGYVSVIMEFSTTIVEGFTGTTTKTFTGLSGNQSISVPDGSSYDLNITNNQEGTWTAASDALGNTSTFANRTTYTINHSGALSNYQLLINTTITDSDRWTHENGTYIHIWNETLSKTWIKSSLNDGDTILYKYDGNAVLSSASLISDMAIWGDDISGDLSKWSGTTGAASIADGIVTMGQDGTWRAIWSTQQFDNDIIFEYRGYIPSSSHNIIGYGNGAVVVDDYGGFESHAVSGTNLNVGKDGTDLRTSSDWTRDAWERQTIKWVGSTMYFYEDGVQVQNSPYGPYDLSTEQIGVALHSHSAEPKLDWVFARQYAAIEPTYINGTKQQTTGTTNITASITGDSNEQSYNTSQTREFTLTPTGATNNVLINTTSADYDVTVTTYWTEDTVKISETLSNGYANITVQYTPSDYISAGVINATYNTIDFAAHDYTGSLTVSVDGVDYSSNGTRLLNDVNTTIVYFDNSTHYINFSIPYNPPLDLYSPNDTATLSYAYPPLTHDVEFVWEQTTGTYKYTVVDYDTGATISSNTVSSNTTTVALSSGQYKWYINGYDDVFDEYSPSSSIRSFTVADTFSHPNDTVVHGVVYEYILGVQTPLDTALVNIWNNTWSGSSMTGTNGYFVFQGLHNSTYSMRATKPGYVDGNIELVTPTFNTTLTRDILLQSYTGAGREYVTHYVLFTVKTLWGTLYSGVEVNVYLGNAITPQYTGTTGTDGSVGFELVESSKYRLTFIDASQGIDEEITIYPVKSEYPVYIIKSLLPDDDDIETEEVVVSITTAEINDTHAYINVTYTDAMAETTDLNIFINQSDESDPFNQTVITSAALGATSSVTQSFLISNYEGQAYFVNVGATHTTFESIKRTYAVRFDGMVEDYGFGRMWVWIAVGGMMLLGGMFKASKAKQGALIVCIAGWVFMAMGMFDVLGSGAKLSIGAGLGLGTVLAVMSLMAKKDREETT